MSKILVSGSIAYDRIMDFPGRFKDHIMPDKIHMLNVCFGVNRLTEGFGGTAGNIAFNLNLLKEQPVMLGVVGDDFAKYAKWLRKNKINFSKVEEDKNEHTAGAYVITDQDNNQITGFYRGPIGSKYCKVVKNIKGAKLAIISPDCVKRMVEYVRLYQKLGIPYISDPGQQLTALSNKDLRALIKGSKVYIGNDYEIESTLRRLKITQKQLEKMTEILVITQGSKGSTIYQAGKKIKIPPAKPKNTCDPTGAGDAYRAGLIKGMLEGWSLEKAGRLAGLVSVYTVEKYGTQTHTFTWAQLKKRYRDNFGESL